MKKEVLLILFIVFGLQIYGQAVDSIPGQGFSFPIGTRATIQLVPIDSVNFNYRVIKFEAYHEIIDLESDKKLLSDSIGNNTVEFIFTYGMYGSDEKGKDSKIVLELRSGSAAALEYQADIQVPTKDFKSTSVEPLMHGVLNREFWPYQIDMIALHGFRKYQNRLK
jgi:hypothetical protein